MEKKRSQRDDPSGSLDVGEEKVIPVVREDVEIGKRRVDSGATRVRKLVHEREEVVDEPLLQDEVVIERLSVNRYLDHPLPVRQEGDVTIVPVIEEVLFVEKRLLLKEELRISKRVKTVRDPRKVTLREEEAVVERLDPQERE